MKTALVTRCFCMYIISAVLLHISCIHIRIYMFVSVVKAHSHVQFCNNVHFYNVPSTLHPVHVHALTCVHMYNV